MQTGPLVFSLTAAGVLGGVVGAFLVGGGDAPPASDTTPTVATTAPAPTPTTGELEELRARLEAMEANLTANAGEVANLRAALNEEQAANKSLVERLDSVESSSNLGTTTFRPGGQIDAPTIRLAGMSGGKWKKMHELRGLKTDEERWQKTREALGLTHQQETELKSALDERKKAMKDAFATAKTQPTGDNASFTVSMPDPKAMRAAQDTYKDRVDTALNAEQAKKWRGDGYESAMGGGGGGAVSFISVSGSHDESK